MKRVAALITTLSLAGCVHGSWKAEQREQEEKQAVVSEEFKSEKIYRIIEEKGTYYVVRLKSPGAAILEKEPPRVEIPVKGVLPKVAATVARTEEQAQTPAATTEKRPEFKIEVPQGAILGGASGKQTQAITDLVVDSHHVQIAEMNEPSKEAKTAGEEVKKESRLAGESLKKDLSATLKSQLIPVENRLKSLEDLSSKSGRSEINVFFPQDKSFLLKGTPEHNRLDAFADSLSKEAQGKRYS